MNFLDADYSAIEARIVNWLAGQEDALAEYRAGVDRYKRMASVIYGIPESQVNKFPMRFIGKQTVLGCIAEGQLVLTDCGLIPIEKVCSWHRVWDGLEWVNHEGVIYQGHREVITYQGLTATRCHPVYCVGSGRTTDFWSAWQQKRRLTVSAKGGAPIRTVATSDESSVSLPQWIPLGEGEVPMWGSDVSGLSKLAEGFQQRMRILCSQGSKVSTCSHVAREAHGDGEETLHRQHLPRIQMVRSTRNRISFQIPNPRRELDYGQFGAASPPDGGSEKQQWALRGWESTLCNSATASAQHNNTQTRLLSHGLALQPFHGLEIPSPWLEPETNSRKSMGCSFRETETVESYPKTVACFDILNAGPRHRYTVSNVLVHNCSYQMGPPKFRKTCEKYGYKDMPEGLEFKAVKAFRARHKKIVQYWEDVQTGASQATLIKNRIFVVGKVSFLHKNVEGMPFLLIKLPSGRNLAYPKPRLTSEGLVFFGHQVGVQWGDVSTFGGKLVENIVQGVAADIMAHGAHNAEREGYQIATLIHDQALSYKRDGQTPERFRELLTQLPEWASGLPLEAEAAEVPFYKKD